MAATIALIWHTLIYSFGNYLSLDFVTWSYRVQTTIGVIIILSVQSLYTRRVWKLSGEQNRLWPWILIIILVGGYASGISLIYESFDLVLFSQIQRVRWSIYFSFGMATFNDVMIAVAICHFICPETTMFEETKSMAWTIIRYVIISGALTSMCSIAGLITLFVLPKSFYFVGISFVVTKPILTQSSRLNARKSIRNRGANAAHMIDLEASKLEFRSWAPSEETEPDVGSARERTDSEKEEIKGIIIIGRQHDEAVSHACDP
ncbi:hypothetical protein F5887DRAFT_920603 [Amanita rubescens]|nr:hypothetical protein F5887DRAFT_920603 [Amanita rubescens]